jgi:hypothetical protein
MATILDICNSALVKLGAEAITALTDNNKRAKLCALQYPKIKRKLLNENPWNFAIKREELVANGDTPIYGFANTFDLPDDYIRGLDFETEGLEWQREGSTIVANSDTLKIRYIADVDEDLFSPTFEEALALNLAYELTYSMVQSADFRDRLLGDSERLLAKARSYDAQEGTATPLMSDLFLEVRL